MKVSSFFAQQIITGFLVKSIASFDDTLTRIPILAQLTQTVRGKVAFSVGTILALTVILIIAIFFSYLLDLIPFRQQILALLIVLLGLSVYFELFIPKENQKLTQNISKLQSISHTQLIKMVVSGFFISFITLLDDILVLVPLFVGDHTSKFLSLIGVYTAAMLQIILVIFFSKKIERIKYKKEIATLALMILAILVGLGVI